MGLEDLFQILIALAVLFGLFGGRKKQPDRPREPRARPQPRPVRSRPGSGPAPEGRFPVKAQPAATARLPVPASRIPPPEVPSDGAPEGFADEIYRILSGELERRRDDTAESRGVETAEGWNRFEEIRPVEEVTEVEAYSLETLEPAGEASHAAFHKRYVEQAPAPVAPPPGPGARAGQLMVPGFALRGRASLRQAMLWSEILGPPKGLE